MRSQVVDVYDHRHLNLEIPEFRDRVPTVENIAVSAWERLEGNIPGARLQRVRIYETPDLYADCFGPEAVR
jgi:6-pyruvoyltetrahydropterin/6-carboxytetrahydropterin synthase